MNDPLSIAVQCALQAGELLTKLFYSKELSIRLKDDATVVTQADYSSDQLIHQVIQESFPEDLILSEELQPASFLTGNLTDQAIWVVDPLDGTTNFSLGLHIWGILIARLVDGWPATSVAYFPLLKELYTAEKNQGAFLNQTPIKIEPGKYRRLSFFSCCSRTHKNYSIEVPYKTRILGSSAYTFCTVARNISILGFEAAPKIWDISAPWLIVQEAGGVVEPFDNFMPLPLRSGVDYVHRSFPTLIAASTETLSLAKKWISPKSSRQIPKATLLSIL